MGDTGLIHTTELHPSITALNTAQIVQLSLPLLKSHRCDADVYFIQLEQFEQQLACLLRDATSEKEGEDKGEMMHNLMLLKQDDPFIPDAGPLIKANR